MTMEPTWKILALFVLFQVHTSISCRLCDFSIESLASRWIRKPCAFSVSDKSETKYVGFEFRLRDSEETRRAFATVKANFNEFFYSPLTLLNDSCDCNEVPCLNEEQLNNLFVLSVEQACEEAKWRFTFISASCCSVQQALVEIIYRLDEKRLASLKKFTLKEINRQKCIAYLINGLRQTEWCNSFKAKCENVIERISKGCEGKVRKKRDIGVKTTSMCGPSACHQDMASVSPTPLMKVDATSLLALHDFARTSTQRLVTSKTKTLVKKASHNETKLVAVINSGSSDISQNETVYVPASRVLTGTLSTTFPVPSPSRSWKSPTMVESGAQSVSPLIPAYITPPMATKEAISIESTMVSKAHVSTVSYPTSNTAENFQSPTKKLSTSKMHKVTLSPARTTTEGNKPTSAEKSSTITSMYQSTNIVKAHFVRSTHMTFTNSVSVGFVRDNTSTKSSSSVRKLQRSLVFSSSLLVPVIPLSLTLSSMSSSFSLVLQSTPLLLPSSASSMLTAGPLVAILTTHVSSSSFSPLSSSLSSSSSLSPSSSSLSLSSSSSSSLSLSSTTTTTTTSVVRSVTATTSSSTTSLSLASLQSLTTVQQPLPALSVATSIITTKITSLSPLSIYSVASLSFSSSPLSFISSSTSSPPALSDLKPSAGLTPLHVSSRLSTLQKQTFIKKTSIISEIIKQGSLSLTSLSTQSLSFSQETDSYLSYTKTRLSSSILQTLTATPTKPSTTLPAVTETFLIKLKGNCSFIINKEDFKFTFIAALTNLLRISRYDVIVYDVDCGSVDVTFGVKGAHDRNLTSELWAIIGNESFVFTYNGTQFVAFDLRQIVRPSITFTNSTTPSSTPTETSSKHERKRMVFIIFVLIGSVFAALFIFFLVVFLAKFCGCCQKTGKFRMRRGNVRLHAPFETELKRFAARKNIFQGVNYYGEITQLEESRKDVDVEIVEDDIDEELSELYPVDTNIYLLNGDNHTNSYKLQEHKFVFDDDGSCSSVVFY